MACVCVYLICSPYSPYSLLFLSSGPTVQDALTVLGVDAQEQDAIFQVMAAILHLGNIQVGYPPPLFVSSAATDGGHDA